MSEDTLSIDNQLPSSDLLPSETIIYQEKELPPPPSTYNSQLADRLRDLKKYNTQRFNKIVAQSYNIKANENLLTALTYKGVVSPSSSYSPFLPHCLALKKWLRPNNYPFVRQHVRGLSVNSSCPSSLVLLCTWVVVHRNTSRDARRHPLELLI